MPEALCYGWIDSRAERVDERSRRQRWTPRRRTSTWSRVNLELVERLTAEGRRFFRAMARENGDWIGEMFADLSAGDIETLLRLLAKTKASARKAIGNGGPR